MSTTAEAVLERIQAVEDGGGGVVELTAAEIQAFGTAFVPGVKVEDIRQFGIVTIVNTDDPKTRYVAPVIPIKPVNPANDLTRHKIACANARRAGEPEPTPTAYERELLEAEATGHELPRRGVTGQPPAIPRFEDPRIVPPDINAAIALAIAQAVPHIVDAVRLEIARPRKKPKAKAKAKRRAMAK